LSRRTVDDVPAWTNCGHSRCAGSIQGIGRITAHVSAATSTGDWGDLSLEDIREKELRLQHDWRTLSAYTLRTGVKFWIITEADRSVTTFLLPDEY
jgi:hypothetical protein